MSEIKGRLKAFVEKNETRLEVAFFLGGFVLDVLLLSEPDDLFGILQQLVYFFILGSLLQFEILFRLHRFRPRGFLKKFWPYRGLLLHFAFGSLLNLYSLFYIKSASIFSSFLFLLVMLGLVLANELPFVKKANVSAKIAMYAICVFSFFSVLMPIVLGFVGVTPFILAVGFTVAVFYGHLRWLYRAFPLPMLRESGATSDLQAVTKRRLLGRALILPGGTTLTTFVLFYFLGWIPPVPLSVVEQGVYHNVERRDGKYILTFEKPWWKFWVSHDSVFRARSGDRVFFYAQIYSPTRISDSVNIHWLMKNTQGNWVTSDKVPMKIQGGRQAGFRGFSFKINYGPGPWQVRVETIGGIEISRLYFEIERLEGELLSRRQEDLHVIER
jgi:hypothetical protein